jgi:surface antigen
MRAPLADRFSFWRFAVKSLARAGFACAVLVSLSGCATSPESAPPPVATPAAPAPYAGLASGALGASLDSASRTAPDGAEIAALNSGERKTWRGDDGSYGYVTPGASAGDCRDVSHTIYINGRPKVGTGTACKADGGWKLKG